MDRFINYRKLQELREAAKNGNEIAKNIIDKYMGGSPDMESIGRLIDEYYGNAGIDTLKKAEEEIPAPEIEEPIAEEKAEEPKEPEELEDDGIEIEEKAEEAQELPVDISADLDKEMDGLIDTDEFEDMSFGEFLEKKHKDGLRSKKNADYFKAFDQGGREKYLADKKEEFSHGFDSRRRQNERGFNDIDSAIGKYSEMLTDMPDDEIEIDIEKAGKAYDDFTGNKETMGAFGRAWDESDMEIIRTSLLALIREYGKKNVCAVLNTLREDNSAWRKFNDGKIDNAIANYGKSLDNLLK